VGVLVPGGQTIFNCGFNKLDHRVQHTSCTMGIGKFLAAMPCEYQFLEYNLLEQHISLYRKGACQCSVKREIEEALSPFGDLQAAAVLCSLRGPPAGYTEGPCSYCGLPELHEGNQLQFQKDQCSVKREIEQALSPFGDLQAAAVLCSLRGPPAGYTEGPCSYCGLPELHEGNQLQFQKEMSDDDDLHGGAVHDPAQGGPKQLDLKLQISRFESLFSMELRKINDCFNRFHLEYIGRMKVSS
jgi:hypothetical protein